MSELVSVIIPSYNMAHIVPETIESALGQTHKEVEIVLCDDGSKDNTRQVIEQRYGNDPRVKYIWQKNGGVSVARNTAMKAATGDYIAFLDADDIWLPWKLEVQLAALRAFPEAGMVWSDMTAVDPSGKPYRNHWLRRMYSAYKWYPSYDDLFPNSRPLKELVPHLSGAVGDQKAYSGNVFSSMVLGNLVHTSTCLMKRERQEKVGLFDETFVWGEDYNFHTETCRLGPVAYVDVESLLYRLGEWGEDGPIANHGRHEECIAVNFLRTITIAMRDHRDQINLPNWMIRDVFHEANMWAGEVYLSKGNYIAARRYMTAALRYRPLHPRTLGMLMMSWLPQNARQRLRQTWRGAKQNVLGRPISNPHA